MFFHCTENVYQAFVVWLFQQKRVRQINSHHFTSLLYHIWGGCESKPNHTRAVRVCYGVCVIAPIRNIYSTQMIRCVLFVLYIQRGDQHTSSMSKISFIHIYIFVLNNNTSPLHADPERILSSHITPTDQHHRGALFVRPKLIILRDVRWGGNYI